MKITILEVILCVILVGALLTLIMNKKELLNVDSSDSNLTLQEITNLSCDTALDATLGTTLGAQAPFRSIDNPFLNGMYA